MSIAGKPLRQSVTLSAGVARRVLYPLELWRVSGPEAPEGPWYKDFGTFKICGDGEYPKTFLLRGQPARGQKL
jgi:hypothetical protein